MTVPENVYTIILIVAMVMLFVIYIIAVIKSLRISSTSRWFNISALTVLFLLCAFLAINAHGMEPADLGQSLLTLSLVAITGFYALSAYRQANASIKMAKEMREQRYDTVRPVIDIQREPRDEDKLPEAFAGKSGDTSRGLVCVLRNIGLGPAIDMHSFVQNPFVQNPSDRRQRFNFGTLPIGEKSVLTMSLSLEQEDSRIALVVYYKDVYGRTFESSREVRPDEEKGWQVGPLKISPLPEKE